MSGLLLGLVAGLTWAVLPPTGADRVSAVPGEHAARPALWVYLVRRSGGRSRWRLLAAPAALLLHVVAGLAWTTALVVRAADLAIEWTARRVDLWVDPDS
ncbi:MULTISPECIES: hypothetical protein [Frankia]|uniref:Uncharacterized protein n=1 Tax=Candidatus Frankia alpina TaxID=2699483 RepID=A0A4S5EU46_9ACTN|nr:MULTISPECIES: hypothetical protein [Frankia]THJ76067.1 hypothetical protein E7Y31_01770 [Candidatus Frankia alpina]